MSGRPERRPATGRRALNLSLLLILGLAIYGGWLPASGWDWTWQRGVLPVVTLALPVIAYIARLTRGEMDGRGAVVGRAISPVVKVCANPETYARMAEDMDVNAGRILRRDASIEEVSEEIFQLAQRVAAGEPSASEAMGHQEFVLTYKTFEPIGPACLPLAAAPVPSPSA